MNRTLFYILLIKDFYLAGEDALEDVLAVFTWTHVDAHIVGIFTEEKDMVAEYESYLLIEFKNTIQTSKKKSAEGAEFFLVFKYHFVSIYADVMVRSEHINEVVKPKIFWFLRCFVILLVYFLYNSVGYHVF